jgi:hypothetical protein
MCDPQTGQVSRPWADFFAALLTRVGGAGEVLTLSEVVLEQATSPVAGLEARLLAVLADLEMAALSAPAPRPTATVAAPAVPPDTTLQQALLDTTLAVLLELRRLRVGLGQLVGSDLTLTNETDEL